MKAFVVFGVLLHLLFLYSIFYIYFQTIIVEDLTPQSDLKNPPAKRLILFVADGLRAESFFKYDCNRTPFLKKTLLEGGILGVSHTRVPTESRPGHVALIAGLYEDPSAIFRGWQENPVDFDSVFNRSRRTYGWGSPDILPMFEKGAGSRVQTFTYNPDDEDFSGKIKTTGLDTWVFERVQTFLNNSQNIIFLKNNDRVILFLHLLGLDTAGHIHKPHSELYSENLQVVDKGIFNIVTLIEKQMNYDEKTAYIFTADHGMTDRGSHGSGDTFETETPFLAWGAGIKKWQNSDSVLHIKINGFNVPRHDIKQADVAPLLSSLIGVAVPVNSFGRLPKSYLDVSEQYLSDAMKNNALQLLAQFKKLCRKADNKVFDFNIRTNDMEDNLNILESEMSFALSSNNYDKSVQLADQIMELAIKGIEFFQTYYKFELLLAITITMIGWLLILTEKLSTSDITRRFIYGKHKIEFFIIAILLLVIIAFNILQDTPPVVVLYFTAPFFTWVPVYINKRKIQKLIFAKRFKLTYILIFIITIEVLVFSFFFRWILCLLLISHSIYLYFAIKNVINYEKANIKMSWASSSLLLALFPALPVVTNDSRNITLLSIGTVLWVFKSYDFLLMKNKRKFDIFQAILLTITGLHFLYVIINLNNNNGLSYYNQILSWVLLIISIFSPVFSSIVLKDRIIAIINSLVIPYLLLSLSYESLFFFAFSSNLFYWLHVENILQNQLNSNAMSSSTFEKNIRILPRDVNIHDIRRMLIFMQYLLISFFGTGNIASVSSFDPNWVRCFVSTFSPFLMTSLIVFKLAIPILLLLCILKALHIITRISTDKLFMLILIICDLMGLNFLYLVRNEGSWLDIGTSISHFIIVQVTVLVLFLLYGLASLLTSADLSKSISFTNKFNKD